MVSRQDPGGRNPALADVTHVLFDAGGTLLFSRPAAAEIFRRTLAKRGRVLDSKTLAKALRSPDLIVTLIRPITSGLESEFFRSLNSRLVEHLGVEPDGVALDDIHAAFEKEVVYWPYQEALRALKALKAAGFHTGVVSNFSHRLPGVLKRSGLAPYLDTVTYSFEAGAEKPHPKIFRTAISRTGTTPEHVLMVGDSYEADYLGARHAGMHALLLCRHAEAPVGCPSIRSLEELPARLGSGRSRG